MDLRNSILDELAKKHPKKAIYFQNEFLEGDIDAKYFHPFGFVPNDWDGETLHFHYPKTTQEKIK